MSSSTFPRTKPSNHLLNKIFTLFIHAKSKNNRFPLIYGFVTIRNTKGYKHLCKRCPFTLQKGAFYTSKGHLLPRKRASFAKQLGNYFTTRRDNTLSFLSIPLFYKTIQRKGYPSLSTLFLPIISHIFFT